MNNDLSPATNVRMWNAGYAIRHRIVRMKIREKLGPSKPRRGLNHGSFDLSAYWKFAVDGGREYQGGYSASNSLLFGVKGEGSTWTGGAAKFSLGLELLSSTGTCSMLRVQGRGR